MILNKFGFSTPRILAIITMLSVGSLGLYSGAFGTFSMTLISGNTCTSGYGYASGYGYGYGYNCTPAPSTGGGGGGGGGASAGTSSSPFVSQPRTTTTTTDKKPVVVKAQDIEKSPYKSAIETLIKNKIVNNVAKFEPEKPITRAEFVKLLANAYGFEKVKSKKKFRDVNYRSDLALYISFGVEMGWINVQNTNFSPNDPITQGEAQKLLDVIEEKAVAGTVAQPSATITRGQAAEMIVAWMNENK